MNKFELQERTKKFAVRVYNDETLFWLEFIIAVAIFSENKLKDLISESKELLAIFTSAVKTSKNKSQIVNCKL